jgi:hypothetical protein
MKRSSYIMAVLTAAVLIALAGCKGGREGTGPRNTLATAEETVKAYCDLDAKGTRLTSETWSRVLPYISWTEEAGFDRAIVISKFRIGGTQKQSDTAYTVAVEYQVMGILSGDYASSPKTETVQFKVKKTREGWKITDPDFMPPHVLLQPMVEHLQRTKNMELARKIQEAPKE